MWNFIIKSIWVISKDHKIVKKKNKWKVKLKEKIILFFAKAKGIYSTPILIRRHKSCHKRYKTLQRGFKTIIMSSRLKKSPLQQTTHSWMTNNQLPIHKKWRIGKYNKKWRVETILILRWIYKSIYVYGIS
jgi:hypothetical protein